jgi:cation diffusion facilitator family transporter
MSEKQRIARISLLISTALSLSKLILALFTGSLALLSEALHNGVDVLATFITLTAVHISDLPPDDSHNYGHGKVENLSAFGESIILVMTAGWIGWRAVLGVENPQINTGIAGIIAIGILVVSIFVDLWRSIQLSSSAKKFSSQAIQASSIHFGMDMVSSCVVLTSLLIVYLSNGQHRWIDSLGAGLVALIMIFTAGRLGLKAIDVLMDRAPAGLEQKLQEAIRRVPGVCDVPRVRARQAGKSSFVDATILVDPKASLEEAHRIAISVEVAVAENDPNIDITVQIEPGPPGESPAQIVRTLAHSLELPVHAVRSHEINGRLYLSFHANLPAEMSVAQAHKIVTELEKRVRLRLPQIADISSHIEPGVPAEPTADSV